MNAANALVEETIDLNERLEVFIDDESYDSTMIVIKGENGQVLKETEVIGSRDDGQVLVVNGEEL